MSSSRHYCSVYGCKNQRTNKQLSFFTLPKDEERRKKWLEIIDRLDLIKPNLRPNSYIVCSKHFETSSMIFVPQLKPDALPTKCIQETKRDQATQTDGSNITSVEILKKTHLASKSKQTLTHSNQSKNTHITAAISQDTPRKRKLSKDLQQTNLKKRKLQNELEIIKTEVLSEDNKKFMRFTFDSEDEVSKRFCKLIEWQNKLKNTYEGNRYDPEFKLFALNFHLASPQTYRCLKTFLRLPSESTLERFKMIIPLKFNDRVLNFLSAKLMSLPKNAKYCTLSIGEMILKRHLYYDTKRDEIIGLHNINGQVTEEVASHACAIMLRGIYVNWKQPIAYSFLASAMHYKDLENWLDEVITKLLNIGIDVRAIISDQGTNFDKFAKEIKKVTMENPYFVLNGKKIYYIFDVPHLLKCVRNNLLTNDFKIDDKLISWKYIESLYTKQNEKNLKIIPRVTEKHIHPNNFQKMRLNYATQVFSLSVYAALNTLIVAEIFPEDAKATADFVEKMNRLFDVLNSSTVKSKDKFKKAFSFEKYQMDVLEEALDTFKNIIAVDRRTGKHKTNEIKTFKNIQISIQSIVMLASDLLEEGLSYIFTGRLNQDGLDNFFDAIRQQGGNCKDPTSIQFQRAFSKLFLSNMVKNSRFSSCQEDVCDILQKVNTIFERSKQTDTKTSPSLVALDGDTDYRFDLPMQNPLAYVSGYLLFKCNKKHNCPILADKLKKVPNVNESGMFTHFKAYNKSSPFYGDLKVPPETFNDYIRRLEIAFTEKFSSNLMERTGSNLYDILKSIPFNSLCPCFPHDYLVKLFIRFRIFTVIKFTNASPER